MEEEDPCSLAVDALVGTWKRHLEWKQFGGGFQSIRASNTVVKVEECEGGAEAGCRLLKWSFGKALGEENLHFGYVMKLEPGEAGGDGRPADTRIEWQYDGRTCSGVYQPATRVVVLNFFLQHSTHVITYRSVDAATMSVCIVEVDEDHMPVVQLGNMVRLSEDH